LGVGERAAVIVVGDIPEGVEAEDEWELPGLASGIPYSV